LAFAPLLNSNFAISRRVFRVASSSALSAHRSAAK
jgi:hypothetical protein